MAELIVVIIASVLIGGGWICVCISNAKSAIEGICVAIGLPLMVASMISLFVYVGYCFHKVLS